METVQWIFSTGAGLAEATKLSNDLSRLETSLPRAHLLIDRAEWGRFKKEELAALLSQLKDTTYDAEDLLREFHDQELRHKIEDADRSRAGQLLSSSLTLARNLIHGSKTTVQETQSKLDKVVAEIEGTLNLMGLNVEPVQLMPETTSVIGEQVLFGRVKELDRVIEMLRVTIIGRDSEQVQLIKLLGVPLARDGRSASATGKRAAVGAGNASRSRAGEPTGIASIDSVDDDLSYSSAGLSGGLGVGSGAGFLLLVLGATFATRKIKHRRAKMLRRRFFKQNRGRLLQQLVSQTQRADIAERMVIPLGELEKATNNFTKLMSSAEEGMVP